MLDLQATTRQRASRRGKCYIRNLRQYWSLGRTHHSTFAGSLGGRRFDVGERHSGPCKEVSCDVAVSGIRYLRTQSLLGSQREPCTSGICAGSASSVTWHLRSMKIELESRWRSRGCALCGNKVEMAFQKQRTLFIILFGAPASCRLYANCMQTGTPSDYRMGSHSASDGATLRGCAQDGVTAVVNVGPKSTNREILLPSQWPRCSGAWVRSESPPVIMPRAEHSTAMYLI